MRKIKLMADYQCYPIWETKDRSYSDVDPFQLPISNELATEIAAWGRRYDETLNLDDPATSGFASTELEEEFCRWGERLFERLKSELTGGFVVAFKPPGGLLRY